MDACVGAVTFWLVGYGIAFGSTEENSGWIGSKYYAGTNWNEHGHS